MNGGPVSTIMAYLYKYSNMVFMWFARLYVNAFAPRVGEVLRDVPYASESGKQTLDIYIPEGAPPFPVVVYIHGGGFHVMDKKDYRRLSSCFANRGYLVFNINYRDAPKWRFPVALSDVSAAVSWTHENAKRYGGDSTMMFLAGDSAGAYFSSMYAEAVQSPRLMSALSMEGAIPPEHLKGLLLFYGAYDMETILQTGFPMIGLMCRGFFGYDPQVYAARAEIASPMRNITRSFPPALIVSGEKDHLHSQSVAFDQALSEADVPHQALFFTKKRHPLAMHHHGFISFPGVKCGRMAMKKACAFLDDPH
jgi:acetyl esterase/lipase